MLYSYTFDEKCMTTTDAYLFFLRVNLNATQPALVGAVVLTESPNMRNKMQIP